MAPSVNSKADELQGSTSATDGTTTTVKLSLQQQQPEELDILEYTPLGQIKPGVQRLRDSFHKEQKTHSLQFRLNQLRNLYFVLKDNKEAICNALQLDFNRSASETKNLEFVESLNDLLFTIAKLHKWVKPEKIDNVSIAVATRPVYIERIPLGVVLIISPFNYPLMLSIIAISGAIAGGNAVVFKPTELTPNFSKLLSKLLTEALDKDIFYVVNGGITETTEVLEQRFDKIMYTGNGMVGKIIARKAAETLTPIILELGGKSPAFVLNDVKDKDISTIARRIVWGRFTNAGQTCVAVDYVLAHESVKDKLVNEMIRIVNEEFYSGLTKDDPGYTHLIHARAYDNLSKIIDSTNGTIVAGGVRDEQTRYISPTIINNVEWDDSTMKSELFGPILPVLSYKNLSEAIEKVVTNHDTPLAQYIFTSGPTSRAKNKQVNAVLTAVRSGATIVNDVLLHAALLNAPFGGVGQSGHGSYHGYFSFKSFTHERTTIEQALWNDSMMAGRYPPYNEKKDTFLEASMTDYNGQVWFSRTGNVQVGGPNIFFRITKSIAGIFALGYYLVTGM